MWKYPVPEIILVGGLGILAYALSKNTDLFESKYARSFATSGGVTYLGVGPVITKFGATGDFGNSSNTSKVMNRMRSRPAFISIGDNAYDKGDASKVDSWYNKYLSTYTGPKYMTLGNEDAKTQAKYKTYFNIADWNYSFDSGNTHFLFVNTESPASSTAVDADLSASKQRGLKWNIVVIHKPMVTARSKHPAQDPTGLKKVFEKYAVDMVLQGHNHYYGRTRRIKGVYWYVVGTGGRDFYNGASSTDFKKIINKVYGYLEVTITDASIYTKFNSIGNKTLDTFTINKIVI
jgi:hypothetical protein